MTLFQVVVLALIQGITEFLPISSSAHLLLPAQLLGWPDQGLAFDVAVHVGTLAAVVWYFRNDLRILIVEWTTSCVTGKGTEHSRLAWAIIIATIPAGLAGFALNDIVEEHLRTTMVLAVTTIVFGVLLGIADKRGSRRKNLAALGWSSALWIGLSQAVALIPGTSRSGITMTMALALGFDRQAAAKFSFLLSIPIIALSGLYKGAELLALENVPWGQIGLATAVSAITAYLCIRLFLRFLDQLGMMPFVWYRLALGALLLGVVWIG